MNERIYLSPPHMGERELELVLDAFRTNWIAPVGPHVDAFENELKDYTGSPNAVALSSGTAAIHLALIILGVKPGDEVICSTFTFAGSCFPIHYVGGHPIFVDSEKDSWNMDPDLLVEAIKDGIRRGKKPKAIIAVHLYGMPCKIEEIMAISREYGVPVIEDAAEALGSTFQGKKLGSFGDFGVFSFNGNKIITTSGGGALVSANESWIKKARFLATQAREFAVHYEHAEIGYNYRLSNVCAAIGRGQLSLLEERVAQRRTVFERYQKALTTCRNISFPIEPPGCFSNRWLTTILIDLDTIAPEAVRAALEAENIESRPLWKPMHLQPVFDGCNFFGSGVSEILFRTGLCLPSGSSLKKTEQDRVLAIINNFVTAKAG